MFFRLIYDDSLAQAAYLIGCQRTGQALLIDPERDIDRYLAIAAAEKLRITHIAETHIHADFLSGARQLAEATGATLCLSDCGPAEWKYRWLDQKSGGGAYASQLLKDGDSFKIGNIEVRAIHTPGHTPEHIIFQITDRGGGATEPMGIISGDFVFVGDVGRPDLLETAAGVQGASDAAARQLFKSISSFRALPDYLQLWPGHGAGSACGKALGAVPQSTVGYEKRFNPAIQAAADEPGFLGYVLEGQPEPPLYFARMKRLNRDGPPLLAKLPTPRRLHSPSLREGAGGGFSDSLKSPSLREGAGGGFSDPLKSPSLREGAGGGFSDPLKSPSLREGAGGGFSDPLKSPSLREGAGGGFSDSLKSPSLREGAGGGFSDPLKSPSLREGVGGGFSDSDSLASLDGRATAILDTRPWPAFRAGHIRGSLHCPFGPNFTAVAGSYVGESEPIALIADDGKIDHAVRCLIRIGLDNIQSFAAPADLEPLKASLEATPEIDVAALRQRMTAAAGANGGGPIVLDVRRATEYAAGHIDHARNIAHTRLLARLSEVPRNQPILVHCQGGQRSAFAAAMLQRAGYDAANVAGGYAAWERAGLPVVK